MSIYAVNLSELNDRSLKLAIGSVPAGSIVLFEDIDGMQAGTRPAGSGAGVEKSGPTAWSANSGRQEGLGVTLSGLLNVVDGFHAPEDVLFVMTTNRVEALDPALLRPGRIDYKLLLGKASNVQKVELYCRFFGEATEEEASAFVESNFAGTMAEFQGLLLALEEEERRHVHLPLSQKIGA